MTYEVEWIINTTYLLTNFLCIANPATVTGWLKHCTLTQNTVSDQVLFMKVLIQHLMTKYRELKHN